MASASASAEERRRRKNKSKKKTARGRGDDRARPPGSPLGARPPPPRPFPMPRPRRGFLARLSSVHAHAIHAGDYCLKFVHEPNHFFFVPYSPTVPLSRFSLDFLPGNKHSWTLVDSRGSLLLLSRGTRWGRSRGSIRDYNVVVCEPLTRRYQGILWPSDVAKYVYDTFLLDGDVNGGHLRVSMHNFRILATLSEDLACVFTSGTHGGWRLVRTTATSDGVHEKPLPDGMVGRVNGSIYWGIEGSADVLALDEATLEFSLVKFPESIWGLYNKYERPSSVIAGEDGASCIVCLKSNKLMVCARRRHQGTGEDEWILENTLGLQEATVGLSGREDGFFQQDAIILTANSRYVLVRPKEKIWVFSIELDTMKVENEHQRNQYKGAAYPYELPIQTCPLLLLTNSNTYA
ncbi:hypothetical protein ZWY2020_045363 [Hordeum vulgare]|nr:hypothetical protein ZWY2020_045363 [Hordeum vulgare]